MPPRIPLDEFGRKRCGRCGEYKELDLFHKDKRTPDGRSWECKACWKIMRRAHYVNNPEQYTAYREANREKMRDYSKARYAAQTEATKQRNADYRKRNPLSKTWKKLWKQRNPDRHKANQHRREARKRGNGGTFTGAQWQALKAHYNYTCLCCKRTEPEIKLTPDHVIPLAQGGGNGIENIQPLCVSCNASKGDRHTTDYRA